MSEGRSKADAERYRQQARELRHPWADRFARAFPDFALVVACLGVWTNPDLLGRGFVEHVALVMIIEFLAIHGVIFIPLSAALLADRLGALGALALASLAYVGLAALFSAAFASWWPTVFFAWLLFSRFGMPFVVARWEGLGADFEPEWLQEWALSCVLWVVLVFPAFLLPIPAVPAAVEAPLLGNPENWLAFTIAYFTCLGLYKFARRPLPELPEPRLKSGVTEEERLQARAAGRQARAARRARLEARRRRGP